MDISHDDIGADLSFAGNKSSDALRAELQAANADLASLKRKWDGEGKRLKEENAVLKDATHRLNAEIRQAKQEAKRAVELAFADGKEAADIQEVNLQPFIEVMILIAM
jgi:hypothetical protein